MEWGISTERGSGGGELLLTVLALAGFVAFAINQLLASSFHIG